MLLKGVAQWFLAKLLEAPKDQMVRTGTEACDWFVAYPESDQRGLVEIEGKTRFGARASPSTSPPAAAVGANGSLIDLLSGRFWLDNGLNRHSSTLDKGTKTCRREFGDRVRYCNLE